MNAAAQRSEGLAVTLLFGFGVLNVFTLFLSRFGRN
jgi:hypothetical protein